VLVRQGSRRSSAPHWTICGLVEAHGDQTKIRGRNRSLDGRTGPIGEKLLGGRMSMGVCVCACLCVGLPNQLNDRQGKNNNTRGRKKRTEAKSERAV